MTDVHRFRPIPEPPSGPTPLDAEEVDLWRLAWHVPDAMPSFLPLLDGTKSADPRIASLQEAVASVRGSKRALADRLLANGLAPEEAKGIAEMIDDRTDLERSDRGPFIATVIALRRADAAVVAAAAIPDFSAVEAAYRAREVVQARCAGEDDTFPFEPIVIPEPKNTTPRRWLYGQAYLRGTVSALVAPGGTGKSMVAIVETLALTTGRHLLHDRLVRPRRVLYWNLEESREEVLRRFTAVAALFKIKPADYEDRLIVISGFDWPLKVASADRNGFTLNEAVIAKLRRTLIAKKIDVLTIDPIVSAHGVPENDNVAMDAVVKALAGLAVQTKLALLIVHHARKSSPGGGRGRVLDADDVRGAAAFVDACRIVRLVQKMTAEEAVILCIEDRARWQYLRLVDGKVNYSPPTPDTKWLQLASVDLKNGDEENPEGDRVGVPITWAAPPLTDGLPTNIINLVQAKARGALYRYEPSAKTQKWFGSIIAPICHLNPAEKTGKAKLVKLIDTWIESGALRLTPKKDANRKDKDFVDVPPGLPLPDADP